MERNTTADTPLPEKENAAYRNVTRGHYAIARIMLRLPERKQKEGLELLKQLETDFLNYQNLVVTAFNGAAHDVSELTRQRDYLFNLVMRMCETIGDEEISCMRHFPSELYHMLLEGMFFTEERAYVESNQETTA